MVDSHLLTRILIIIVTTFVTVAIAIPFIKNIAIHVGAVDIPDARKVHSKIMPRLGGLGIFFGFLVGYMLFGTPSALMNSILIGSFIIVLTGVVDDIKPLKPSTKFCGQLLAALVVTLYGGILMRDATLFGYYFDFGFITYPLSIFFILGCINCINLIDGLDGLAGGVSAIYFLTIGIIATMQLSLGLDYVLTFIMLGSVLGFLLHNFYPAKIFMGDSGSMFLGFIIAVIALLGFKNVTFTSLLIPIIILAIPILDTAFAIIRRLIKKESISKPDKSHIHHQFLRRGFSHRATVLMIYLVNILFAAASIVFFLKDHKLGYIIYGTLLILVITFVVVTDVIKEHKVKEPNKTEKKK